jgi:sterol desaturase/sphingolipid hydroxylase (fatty acid hydroxylase superfamily)
MLSDVTPLLYRTLASYRIALELLVLSATAFAALALLVKGREAIRGARRAAHEIRVNLAIYAFDVVFVAPLVALFVNLVREGVTAYSLALVDEAAWASLPGWVTYVAVVFVGDFASYWRHRLEHTRWLWPTHAIHHSDTEMTWLTLVRFHPLNRIITMVVDVGVLALLGFPAWALVANVIVRHYYGEFIHADLPWTYGPLRFVFVSPAMHRWHHARDVIGAGSNFATVFSVFDLGFGTYHVPGPCTVPLGVTDEMGSGARGQLLYPFVAWRGELKAWMASRAGDAHRGSERA